MNHSLALDALLIAVWRHKPDDEVIVHSDQGSQYDSGDWRRFYWTNNLASSMSRRSNCWDNAVFKSFFSTLKKERRYSLSDNFQIQCRLITLLKPGNPLTGV
ncbi:hypothetical protein XU19_02415 [Vibrio parahaemolyticus]|nr:hypothetical protein XU19_02415 [Vibrio parahaemolyticus]KKY42897.1 hypothetical protein AAY51_09480 [Vibrio parahaemolyticus]KOP94299.1 hypothetical protein ALC61_19710 [Citrobacter amalonaticus]KOP98098.1 hypothetical protein AL012_05165 [Citrobacter amalonaticus]OUE59069.1 integrase catalytic subunit [Citrobacter amalonaticus]